MTDRSDQYRAIRKRHTITVPCEPIAAAKALVRNFDAHQRAVIFEHMLGDDNELRDALRRRFAEHP